MAKESPQSQTTPAIPPPLAGTISTPAPASSLPSSPSPPQPPAKNPLLTALGLPNIRPRLPSRNWLIFLSVTGSFTAAVLYDKYETRRVQRKWISLVAPVAEEPLAANQLPRRVRVYVQAPPGDSLGPAREHFYTYVKPVLAAGGLEWDVVEGRREGDVRFAVAEGARKRRRVAGENEGSGEEGGDEEIDAVAEVRRRSGTMDWNGVQGDLVLGRHAWKEVVRGLHEGWLGPVNKPPEGIQPGEGNEKVKDGAVVETLQDVVKKTENVGDGETDDGKNKAKETQEQEEERQRQARRAYKPAPYNSTADYPSTASLPSSIPEQFGPAALIPFPHLIGFLGTPRRIYRFLNRRKLADEIGRQTAALVLGRSYREFHDGEMEGALVGEEAEWHKSVRNRKEEEEEEEEEKKKTTYKRENVWMEDIVLDERIAGRMRVFELAADDEARAAQMPLAEAGKKEEDNV